jgi:hypothetical protein
MAFGGLLGPVGMQGKVTAHRQECLCHDNEKKCRVPTLRKKRKGEQKNCRLEAGVTKKAKRGGRKRAATTTEA